MVEMPLEARIIATKGAYPPPTRVLTSYPWGWPEFHTPYFKAIHIHFILYTIIISKNGQLHNREFATLRIISA
jgi:hypothetical protein